MAYRHRLSYLGIGLIAIASALFIAASPLAADMIGFHPIGAFLTLIDVRPDAIAGSVADYTAVDATARSLMFVAVAAPALMIAALFSRLAARSEVRGSPASIAVAI
jgi:hypothetical protein